MDWLTHVARTTQRTVVTVLIVWLIALAFFFVTRDLRHNPAAHAVWAGESR